MGVATRLKPVRKAVHQHAFKTALSKVTAAGKRLVRVVVD
jgi:hypothetical protein